MNNEKLFTTIKHCVITSVIGTNHFRHHGDVKFYDESDLIQMLVTYCIGNDTQYKHCYFVTFDTKYFKINEICCYGLQGLRVVHFGGVTKGYDFGVIDQIEEGLKKAKEVLQEC